MNEEIKDPNLGSPEQYDLDLELNTYIRDLEGELKDYKKHIEILSAENEQLKEDLEYAVEVNAEHLKSIRTLWKLAVESKTKHTSLAEAIKGIK